MTHHEYTEELDSQKRVKRGLVALQIFAELTQQGGANAVADTQGTLVVPQLIGTLLHLLDLETLWALYDTRKEAVEALSSAD